MVIFKKIYYIATFHIFSTGMDANESQPKLDAPTLTLTLTLTITLTFTEIDVYESHLKLDVNAVLHLRHIHDLHQDKGDLF